MTDKTAAGPLRRFDALSLRERLLLGLTAVVLLLFAWWMLVYESRVPRTHSLQQANRRMEAELLAARAARDAVAQRLARGVHAEQKARIDELQQRLTRMKRQLEQGTAQLVSPQKMIDLMRGMIDSAPRLRLMSLRRLEVEPLLRQGGEARAESEDSGSTASEDSQALAQDERATLYRHVMALRLQGRYRDILEWLRQLEALPWQLMWNRVDLKALDYPLIEVELTLSTVSASRAWVGL